MSERELREKTSCDEINTEQGNLINSTTNWNLTTELVTRVDVPLEEMRCLKKTNKINAFLPIPGMTMEEALDLCNKFGPDVHIAGQFNSKEDFDHFYDGKLVQLCHIGQNSSSYVIPTGLQINKIYVEKCGYYDTGRVLTWLPYQRNQDSSALVHDISRETLLGDQVDKYYAYWYKGPQVILDLFTLNC